MTKSELKTGMIVVAANGKEYMVYKDAAYSWNGNTNPDVLVALDGSDSWNRLSSYDENMKFINRLYEEFDIVKVIQVTHPYTFIRREYKRNEDKVLWSRKKQYTYAQLREILGEEFEVIG